MTSIILSSDSTLLFAKGITLRGIKEVFYFANIFSLILNGVNTLLSKHGFFTVIQSKPAILL